MNARLYIDPSSVICGLLLALTCRVDATTEWFGDLRSELNPPRLAPFYDVVYDDSDCPQGIHSNVIPEFMYFGEMIGTAAVTSHTECVGRCLANSKCTAANYFVPSVLNKKAYCELLKESQYDNPKLMRPFHNAIYYEKIKCQKDVDQEELQTATAEAELRTESTGSSSAVEETTTSMPVKTTKDSIFPLPGSHPLHEEAGLESARIQSPISSSLTCERLAPSLPNTRRRKEFDGCD
ncbi:Apple domain-containing protein [Aphelenchoides fujianensis]|nr:Apple domain-containing protein [Aphelenchoides fujianensis]